MRGYDYTRIWVDELDLIHQCCNQPMAPVRHGRTHALLAEVCQSCGRAIQYPLIVGYDFGWNANSDHDAVKAVRTVRKATPDSRTADQVRRDAQFALVRRAWGDPGL